MSPVDTHSYPGISADKRGWGSGWPNCQTSKWVTAPKPIFGQVHKDIEELTSLIVGETQKRGYKLKGDGLTGGTSQCWGADCRAIKLAGGGLGDTPSNHSWGLAVDLNSLDNAYGGTKHNIPKWMADLWNKYGFRWGGSWGTATKDWMHFDFMGTPDDAARLTKQARSDLGPKPPKEDDLTNEQDRKLNFINSFLDNLGEELIPGYVKGTDKNADALAKAVGDLLKKAAGA